MALSGSFVLACLLSTLNCAPAVVLSLGKAARRYRFSHRCWRKNSLLAVGAFALAAMAKSVVAEQSDKELLVRIGNGNPVVGKLKSEAERCQECHGEAGISNDARIPNHAGQYAAYLIKELKNFQSGERRYEIMNKMAADLNADDMADIAAYFASMKMIPGDGSGDNRLAEHLFKNGDQARELPSCVSCHGENGKGRIADNVVYPLIGGQRKLYLRRQLLYWKLGERKNSPDAVMNKVAQALSDDDIEKLADYIAGL